MGKAMTILQNAGYQYLGSGNYANVYAKPGANHVIKLFGHSDLAYPKFIELVQSNPNPHFPKFKGKMMKVTNDYYAIQMERLSPLPADAKAYSNIDAGSSTIGYALNDYTRQAAGLPNNDLSANLIPTIMDELEKTQSGIKEACSLIASLSGVVYDIHKNNLMLRGNTLVITDPVAY